MIKKIKEILFGVQATPVCSRPKPGFRTTCHGPFTTFGDWCQEFRVGMLYDRKQVHL